MSLETWVQNAWLKKQPTSAREIGQLLRIVDRDLRDCETAGLSPDSQFTIAYNAALQAASVALRASGYRTAGTGHHVRVIDSLVLTLNVDADTIELLQALGRKRNTCNYDAAGSVSDRELKKMKQLAHGLRAGVLEWLKTNHSELLEGA